MTDNSVLRKDPNPPRKDSWRMFDRIARRYDLLNRVLSLGLDVGWRKRLVRLLRERVDARVLDLATGTGDVLLELCNGGSQSLCVVGLDMSAEMLSIASRKIAARELDNRASLVRGDAVRLPVADGSFDAITMAFGIRNVPDVPEALREMKRALRPGGRALIMEFSLPRNRIMRTLHVFYLRHVLTRVGTVISGDRAAYHYLNKTIESFPYGDEFRTLMLEAGFASARAVPVAFGIATIYEGAVD